MRLEGPVAQEDFEYLLDLAVTKSEIVTDQGMSEDVTEKLKDVAVASPGPELDAAVAAARTAFAAQLLEQETRQHSGPTRNLR